MSLNQPPAARTRILGLQGVVTGAILVVLALLTLTSLLFSDSLYLTLAGLSSTPWPQLSAWFAQKGLLLLVGTAAVLVVWSSLRDRATFCRLAVSGVGIVAAYLISETLKLIVTEDRPCRTHNVVTVLSCPDNSDWSWPSNHATLAAAFTVACILARPRLAWLVVPLAVLVALSRVAAGVHYVHDVLSGLALGTAVVVLLAHRSRPVATGLSHERCA